MRRRLFVFARGFVDLRVEAIAQSDSISQLELNELDAACFVR